MPSQLELLRDAKAPLQVPIPSMATWWNKTLVSGVEAKKCLLSLANSTKYFFFVNLHFVKGIISGTVPYSILIKVGTSNLHSDICLCQDLWVFCVCFFHCCVLDFESTRARWQLSAWTSSVSLSFLHSLFACVKPLGDGCISAELVSALGKCKTKMWEGCLLSVFLVLCPSPLKEIHHYMYWREFVSAYVYCMCVCFLSVFNTWYRKLINPKEPNPLWSHILTLVNPENI